MFPTMRTGFANAFEMRQASAPPHKFIRVEKKVSKPVALPSFDYQIPVNTDLPSDLAPVLYQVPKISTVKPTSFPPVELGYPRPLMLARFLKSAEFAGVEVVQGRLANPFTKPIAEPTDIEAALEYRETEFFIESGVFRYRFNFEPRKYSVVYESQEGTEWKMEFSFGEADYKDASLLNSAFNMMI